MKKPSRIRPLLSLAVIVRNEADLLAELLENHGGLFDEAVVVDTGSDDGSHDRAAGLGAKVHSFPWCDDFSAARNYALDQCTGHWILVLDCDESLSPAGQSRIRLACQGPPDKAYILTQRNYCNEPSAPGFEPLNGPVPEDLSEVRGYIPEPTVRLIPGDCGLSYSGRVHESLLPSLSASGLELTRLDAPIHHRGHLQGPAGRRRRTELYGRLLRMKIKEAGTDPRAVREMASQLISEGLRDQAVRLLGHVLEGDPCHPESHRCRQVLGRIFMEDGRMDDAVFHFEVALRSRPDIPGCWVDVTRALLLSGKPSRARRFLREGKRIFPRNPALVELESQVLVHAGR